MDSLCTSPAGTLCVVLHPEKGRCVHALRDIPAGTLIEACPVLLFDDAAHACAVDATPLCDYYFRWEDAVNALVLGYGSLYNHSYEPNALYSRNYLDRTMEFHALRAIASGEEITINYNGAPDSRERVWFDPVE